MATVLPPPSKRQKVEAIERARQQQDIPSVPNNLGSVRVQFTDQRTGEPTGGPILVSIADASVKNLELLLNSLRGNNVCEVGCFAAGQC
jgi:ribosome assembly protein 4